MPAVAEVLADSGDGQICSNRALFARARASDARLRHVALAARGSAGQRERQARGQGVRPDHTAAILRVVVLRGEKSGQLGVGCRNGLLTAVENGEENAVARPDQSHRRGFLLHQGDLLAKQIDRTRQDPGKAAVTDELIDERLPLHRIRNARDEELIQQGLDVEARGKSCELLRVACNIS